MTSLERLAEVMKVRVRKDACGDQVILGERGNVHEDGAGYSVALMFLHGKSLRVGLGKLAGLGTVRQRGDTEAVMHVAALPSSGQAETLR